MKKFTVNVWASTSVSITLFADDAEEARDLVSQGDFNREMLTQLLSHSHYDWDLGEIDSEYDVVEADDDHEPIAIGIAFPSGIQCFECGIEDTLTRSVVVVTDHTYPSGVSCHACGDTIYKPTNAQEA